MLANVGMAPTRRVLGTACTELGITAAEACADDVIFVLEHCDTDGDRTIDRDELLPMLAEWKARHRLPVLCRCPLRSAPLCHLHDPLCP